MHNLTDDIKVFVFAIAGKCTFFKPSAERSHCCCCGFNSSLRLLFNNCVLFQGVFISKIAEGGTAERDGRLQVGDKVLSVSLRYRLRLLEQFR